MVQWRVKDGTWTPGFLLRAPIPQSLRLYHNKTTRMCVWAERRKSLDGNPRHDLFLLTAVLLHPRGHDRHPAITPSHDPKLFFHIPPTRSSQSSQFSGKDQRERGRDKKTEIVRKRRARP
ncbi:uncharacterized protein AB9X84_015338 [Acanthopagrus schlegelii]